MKKSLILVAALTLAPLCFGYDRGEHSHGGRSEGHTEASEAQLVSATGYVRAIDAESKKLTIEHDPIPDLNWPSMTMRFAYENEGAIKGIKSGDRVKFNFVQQGRVSLLKTIEKAR
ncbi:MAG: copper-binding protein [Helicobacteraceae bacterium]|nr:copper-binding protein [Helicobacteraceae bacterium]